MPRTDSWCAEWCCERLLDHEDILEVTQRSKNSVHLSVKDMPRLISVATMSQHRVELELVPSEFHDTDTEFLLNIPKDAYFSGELLLAAKEVPIGVGGVADLYRATAEKEFRLYIPKETQFILRGLEQHTAVRNVMRLNSCTYLILKLNGQSVRVLAINEYDLTSDAIRSGIEKYGQPDIVLASNPNSRLSTDTRSTAAFSGTNILTWKQLLAALRHE